MPFGAIYQAPYDGLEIIQPTDSYASPIELVPSEDDSTQCMLP